MLDVLSVKVTGNPSSSFWVQIHEFKAEGEGEFKKRGYLIAIVSIEIAEAGADSPIVEVALLGRQVLTDIQEEYLKKDEVEAFNALKLAVEKAYLRHKENVKSLNIMASALVEGVIYSAIAGRGQVAILRSGMFAKILIGKDSTIVASGYPQDGDVLLLGTEEFFKDLSFGVLKASLEGRDNENIRETITSIIHSKEESGLLAAAVLVFDEKKEVPIELPVVAPPGRSIPFNQSKLRLSLGKLSKFLSGLIPQRNLYVKEESREAFEPGRRKTTITVGIILLTLLLISIVFGIRQRNIKVSKGRYEARLTQAKHDFDESASLALLNPERARELFLSSKETSETLVKEGVKDPELDDLVKRLNESQGEILRQYEEEVKDFVDLSLLSNGFKGSDLASSGQEIFVLDKNARKVVQVSIENKKAEVVAGPEDLDSGIGIASYEDRFFVLTNDGVKELGKADKYVIDKSWEGDALIYAYAGNLYVLDKVSSTVTRYPAIEGGFASKQNWFGAGVSPDLTGAVSWAIDGNVWILLSGSRILRFSLGSPQAFSISGLGSPLANPVNLYTNEDLESLYILDPQNSRLIVVDKKGEYKAQYVADQLKGATDLVVSEKDKRAVFLIEGNLKSIDLKHI